MTAKTICGIFLVFFLGGVAGGLLSSIYFAHRTVAMLQKGGAAYVETLERRSTRGLHLDQEQREKIHQLFGDNLAARQRLQQQIQPQVQVLNQQTMRGIRSVLNREQEQRFGENLREFHRRFSRPGWGPRAFEESATNAAPVAPPAP